MTPDTAYWKILPLAKQEELSQHGYDLCEVNQQASFAFDVLTFMIAFDQFPKGKQEAVSKEDFALATDLIDEELKEFTIGYEKFRSFQSFENMVEMVDGCVDLIYVLLWSMLKFGIPFDKCFAEVQRSNMAKLNPDGSYSKKENGKVKKPESWTPPDLHGILIDHFDGAVWNGNMRRHT